MCPIPTSLLFILLSFFLLHHPPTHAACEPAVCGNLTVKYSFWIGAPSGSLPEPSWGPPAFELWCTGSSTASLRGSSINILGIDYGNSSFVASTVDDGVCRADLNISSSSSLAVRSFQISASNRALCFLYNCNGTEPRGPGFVNATAVPSCGTATYAYLGGSYDRDTPPAIPAGTCTYAYLPVLGTEATTAADYARMLKAGFLLEWGGGGIGDCDACVNSGGECRYSNAFACLCPGGKLRGSTCAGEYGNNGVTGRKI